MYFLIAWNILLSISIVALMMRNKKLKDNVVRLNPPEYFDIKVFGAGKLITKGRDTVMSNIQDAQKVTLVITAKSKAGNDAVLADKPVWKTSDALIVTVENISEDGLTADVVATGALGSAVVSFEADKTPDVADDAEVVAGSYDVVVVAGPAETLVVVKETVSSK